MVLGLDLFDKNFIQGFLTSLLSILLPFCDQSRDRMILNPLSIKNLNPCVKKHDNSLTTTNIFPDTMLVACPERHPTLNLELKLAYRYLQILYSTRALRTN